MSSRSRTRTYDASSPIVVKVQGAPGRPIRIVAQTVGGVTIAGSDGFDIVAPAATRSRFRRLARPDGSPAYAPCSAATGLRTCGYDARIDRTDRTDAGKTCDLAVAGEFRGATRTDRHLPRLHQRPDARRNPGRAADMSTGSAASGYVRCIGRGSMLSISRTNSCVTTLLDPGGAATLRTNEILAAWITADTTRTAPRRPTSSPRLPTLATKATTRCGDGCPRGMDGTRDNARRRDTGHPITGLLDPAQQTDGRDARRGRGEAISRTTSAPTSTVACSAGVC